MNWKNLLYIPFFLLLFAANLSAHESRPLFIQIEENATGAFTLKVNIPNSIAENNLPNILFPVDFIEQDSLTILRKTPSGFLRSLQFEASKSSIKGQNIQIQFPKFNPSITSIVQIDLQNEDIQTLVIGPDKSQILIPKTPSQWAVVRQYTELGIKHIWAGIDHLLFLVCLFIITGFSRKLFWTITGFTFAHSITLIASTLGWIQLSIKPVESCIALSIIFLCNEIAHHHSTQKSLTYRYPVLVSSSFGLLHGFGFASVLGEIGLPKSYLMEALLFFNIGVEIGQLLFLIALFLSQYLLVKFFLSRFKNWSKPAFTLAIYSVGILASYWFFERLF
ncbi:MAG: HupE/UreJ family protein [Chitinophagales bacterium]